MRLEERERARKQAEAPRACREGREGQAPFSIAHGPHNQDAAAITVVKIPGLGGAALFLAPRSCCGRRCGRSPAGYPAKPRQRSAVALHDSLSPAQWGMRDVGARAEQKRPAERCWTAHRSRRPLAHVLVMCLACSFATLSAQAVAASQLGRTAAQGGTAAWHGSGRAAAAAAASRQLAASTPGKQLRIVLVNDIAGHWEVRSSARRAPLRPNSAPASLAGPLRDTPSRPRLAIQPYPHNFTPRRFAGARQHSVRAARAALALFQADTALCGSARGLHRCVPVHGREWFSVR
jgi:hypothetical protein